MVIKRLSVTAWLSFFMAVLLIGSSLIENLQKMISMPSAINVIHCIGWSGIGILIVAFMLFDKPKVAAAIDFAKPLFVLFLCVWACYTLATIRYTAQVDWALFIWCLEYC